MAGSDTYGGNVSPVASDAESPQLVSTVDELIALVRAAPPPAPGVGPFTFQFMLTLHALELGDGDLPPWDGDGVVAASDGRFVPASSEAMARLRETTVAEETREEDECAVCLKSFDEGDRMGAMPCSHEFHDGCIRRWLAISRLCPLCRFALQSPPRGS